MFCVQMLQFALDEAMITDDDPSDFEPSFSGGHVGESSPVGAHAPVDRSSLLSEMYFV